MNPVKHKKLLEEAARQCGMDPRLAGSIISHYYKSVQQKLSYGGALAVNVPALGTFVLKPKAVDKKILKTRAMLEKIEPQTSMQAYAIRSEKTQELEQLESQQARLLSEKARKQEIKHLRKARLK